MNDASAAPSGRRIARPTIPRVFASPCRALLAAALLACATSVGAQIPGLPSLTGDAKGREAKEAAPPETPEQAKARIAEQYEAARELRDRLGNENAAGVPEGIGSEEIGAARRALGQVILSVEGEQRALRDLADARKERADAEIANSQWTGFAEKPPYSMLMVEDLREAVETLRTKIAALATSEAIATAEAERSQNDLKRAEAALRQAREAAANATAEQAPVANWRAEMAQWVVRGTAASALTIRRLVEVTGEQALAQKELLKLAERKLEAALKQVAFTADDVERVRSIERGRLARLEKEQAAVVQRAVQASRERAEAARALDALRADPATPPARTATAEARLRAADAAVVSARLESYVQDALAALSRGTPDLWKLRLEALTSEDAGTRREAAVRLRALADRLKPWAEFGASQQAVIGSERREQALRIAQTDPASEALRYENAVMDALRRRADSVQALRDASDRMDRTFRRWGAELADEQAQRPWPARIADGWASAVAVARQVWTFELFDIDDTIEANGQKVTVARGVTVGKSIGALMLFIIGYWAAARLTRKLETFLVGRSVVLPAPARTMRRWALAVWGFALVVLTLNLARIPLTVFAFLGGALAIGVGFGTQTIIRNFISGLIVLMERQVRVGDIVEVDGITGTVTEVNLRSSTVHGFEGVEAILPNSMLLENRVTNWTRSDRKVRRTVKVGVAYGSPAREVASILKECAERHGLVLKAPEPLVLFDDFGDSALVFTLYFWIELNPGISGAVIMSDLRFMIEKRLAESGIALPYPQRDVHLDASRPLQVEVTNRPAGPAAGV
jgi:potassium efflux system protein